MHFGFLLKYPLNKKKKKTPCKTGAEKQEHEKQALYLTRLPLHFYIYFWLLSQGDETVFSQISLEHEN